MAEMNPALAQFIIAAINAEQRDNVLASQERQQDDEIAWRKWAMLRDQKNAQAAQALARDQFNAGQQRYQDELGMLQQDREEARLARLMQYGQERAKQKAARDMAQIELEYETQSLNQNDKERDILGLLRKAQGQASEDLEMDKWDQFSQFRDGVGSTLGVMGLAKEGFGALKRSMGWGAKEAATTAAGLSDDVIKVSGPFAKEISDKIKPGQPYSIQMTGEPNNPAPSPSKASYNPNSTYPKTVVDKANNLRARRSRLNAKLAKFDPVYKGLLDEEKKAYKAFEQIKRTSTKSSPEYKNAKKRLDKAKKALGPRFHSLSRANKAFKAEREAILKGFAELNEYKRQAEGFFSKLGASNASTSRSAEISSTARKAVGKGFRGGLLPTTSQTASKALGGVAGKAVGKGFLKGAGALAGKALGWPLALLGGTLEAYDFLTESDYEKKQEAASTVANLMALAESGQISTQDLYSPQALKLQKMSPETYNMFNEAAYKLNAQRKLQEAMQMQRLRKLSQINASNPYSGGFEAFYQQ